MTFIEFICRCYPILSYNENKKIDISLLFNENYVSKVFTEPTLDSAGPDQREIQETLPGFRVFLNRTERGENFRSGLIRDNFR